MHLQHTTKRNKAAEVPSIYTLKTPCPHGKSMSSNSSDLSSLPPPWLISITEYVVGITLVVQVAGPAAVAHRTEAEVGVTARVDAAVSVPRRHWREETVPLQGT